MSEHGSTPSPAPPPPTPAPGGAPASRKFVVLAVLGGLVVVALIACAAWLLVGSEDTAAVPDELAAICGQSSQLRAAVDDSDLAAMAEIVRGWDEPETDPSSDQGVADAGARVVTVLAAWRYIEVVSGDPEAMLVPALRLELQCTRLGLVDEVAAADNGAFQEPSTTAPSTTAPPTTTTAAPAPPEPAPGGEACEGASGCAFENGIDLSAVRRELAAELTGSGLSTAPDDVDCEQGNVPPNRVPVGDSFECVVTPDVNGSLSAFDVTVTAVGQYRWDWAEV